FRINPDNDLTLSVLGSQASSGGPGRVGINPTDGLVEANNLTGPNERVAHIFSSNATDATLKWSSALFDKRLLIDASLGWHHENTGRLPTDGSTLGSTT